MELQSFSGVMSGTTIYCKANSQGYTPLLNTRASRWHSFFEIIRSKLNFFHLPLSVQALQEYQELQQIIQQIQITPESKDTWHYIWANDKYTSSKFYHFPYKDVHPPRPFVWIWDSKCCNKIKVFMWLLLMDRLNVRNILRRKKCRLDDGNYHCVLCTDNREET
jgi:hypothetical protein